MKVEVVDKSPVEKLLAIQVEPENYQKTLDQVIKDVGRELQIPGFRRGKAPRKAIVRRFGMEAFKNDLLDKVIPETTRKVLEEKDLHPLATPICSNYADIVLEEGKPITFNIAIEVKPEFELKDYKGLELVRIGRGLDVDEVVEQQINNLQQQQGTMEPVEEDRELKEGDIAHVDFSSYRPDGEPVPTGSEKNYYMTLEENSFVPGFMEHVVGHKPGDEWEFTVTFPENYVNKDIAGKDITFKMKLHGIMKKELPPRDDELAKSTGRYETYEELKNDFEKRVRESIEQQQKNEMQEQVLNKLAEQLKDVTIPRALIDFHMERFVSNLQQQLQMQGKTIESHLASLNTNLDEFKERFAPQAENAAKAELILDKLAELENVEVQEEELDKEIEKVAGQLKQDVKMIRRAMMRDGYINALKFDIRNRKIFDMIIDNAEITEKTQDEILKEETEKAKEKNTEEKKEETGEETVEKE
ncbi:MAG: trigger factor [Vulcanimicrobiota bacterium]